MTNPEMKKGKGLMLFCVFMFANTWLLSAQTVTKQYVDTIVHRLSDQLEAHYPFPEISARYKQKLLARLQEGAYHNLLEEQLAKQLTTDLNAVHKDRHLNIIRDSLAYRAAVTPVSALPDKQPAEEPAYEGNYGFDKVEIDHFLSTAYISVPGPWHAVPEAFAAATAAMNLATGSKHIIIDIRRNGGGSGAMGRFLASYFYATGNEQYYLYGFHKDKSQDEQEWTLPFVPGKTAPDAKLYILTGRNTGSAAEGFAFAMQRLKRGVVIGDTTAGAGIAGSYVPLQCNLMLFLPVKMIVAPHTTKGWEGDGVIPDTATGKQDAWLRTRKIIIQDLLKNEKDEERKEMLTWRLEDFLISDTRPIDWARYNRLPFQYSEKISIRKKDGLLWYGITEKNKITNYYQMQEIKPDVLVIKDMLPELGANAARLYINRDTRGNIIAITRKTYLRQENNKIVTGSSLSRSAKQP